jgi:hypothetical protein
MAVRVGFTLTALLVFLGELPVPYPVAQSLRRGRHFDIAIEGLRHASTTVGNHRRRTDFFKQPIVDADVKRMPEMNPSRLRWREKDANPSLIFGAS